MKLKVLVAVLLATAGLGGAVAMTNASDASAHTGYATVDCQKGVQFNFQNFQNAKNNTVFVTVKDNGKVIYGPDAPITWDGSTYPTNSTPNGGWIQLNLDGSAHNFDISGYWTADSANGDQGSFENKNVALDCTKPCQPRTVTIVQTVPGPTQTVVQTVPGPTQTVTNTVTNTQTVPGPTQTVVQTVPGPTQTVTNAVTQTVPGPTQTVTKTVTVKSPPKIITKTKTKVVVKIKKVYVTKPPRQGNTR